MRILLVEDEAALRETLAARLKRDGYAVDVAADGEEGLYLGKEVPFDVAIIDLGLPRMSGMDLVTELRKAGRKYPILILTARAGWQDKVEGLKTGADDYLVKPFHVEELLARINALVRRASGWTRSTLECGPIVLDTSSIIDGRLADLAETNIIESQLIMPGFVLGELQAIADSQDRLRRARGRRGLDILNRLRTQPKIEFQIYDRDLPEFAGQPVDMKLVILAKHLEGKIITGDFNLNKVAKVHNVPVINLNEVAASLRPQFLPGESFEVRIAKAGEGPEQGIGYLDDGTMVVIEGGRHRINATLPVVVTSTLQTQAGRMLFAKVDESAVRSGA